MGILHQHLGIVVEPSGAVGLAEILNNKGRFKDKLVAIVISHMWWKSYIKT